LGFRFYFQFFLILCFSFLSVGTLTHLSFQKHQAKKNTSLLKLNLKIEALQQLNRLNNKLSPFHSMSEEALKDLNSLHEKTIPKAIERFFIFDNQNLELLYPHQDHSQTNNSQADESQADDLQTKTNDLEKELEPELLEALKSDNLTLDKILFKKVKEKLYLIKKKQEYLFIFVVKRSYFKQSLLKNPLEQQKSKNSTQIQVAFATFNKDQDRFFYNSLLRDSSQFIKTFYKNPTPKYITRKSKTDRQILSYLQKWKGTNLLLITQVEKKQTFLTNFIEKDSHFILTMSLAFVLLILSLSLFYTKLYSLSKAYSFLNKAIRDYSESGHFPAETSQNPLLSFYRNRQEVLYDKKEKSSQPEEETLQLQELIKKELKKLNHKYPHLILHKDFQTDIKMLGFQKFFRTIFNELLLNAVESMGTKKKQKIDVSIKEEKQKLILSIRDYGCGLKEGTEKPFQLYYSSKSQLGVGLNLVESIVTANGGKIELFNQEPGQEPGQEQGLLVKVCLPLSCFLKK